MEGPAGEAKSAWIVRFLDGRGVKRQKTFARKKEADAYAVKVKGERGAGVLVADAEAVTIRKLCDEFMRTEDRRDDGRIGANRYVSLKHAIDSRIVPRLGFLAIRDLTPTRVIEFYGELRKSAGRKSAGLHQRTAKDTVYELALVEEFARSGAYEGAGCPRRAPRPSRHGGLSGADLHDGGGRRPSPGG